MIFLDLKELEGKWINEYTKLLHVHEPTAQGVYTALAIVHDALCIIELKVKMHIPIDQLKE